MQLMMQMRSACIKYDVVRKNTTGNAYKKTCFYLPGDSIQTLMNSGWHTFIAARNNEDFGEPPGVAMQTNDKSWQFPRNPVLVERCCSVSFPGMPCVCRGLPLARSQ